MTTWATILYIVAAVLVLVGISFAVDVSKTMTPATAGGPAGTSRTYTFLNISGRGAARAATVITFLLAAGALAGAIALTVLD